jgi:hypothetical protein
VQSRWVGVGREGAVKVGGSREGGGSQGGWE